MNYTQFKTHIQIKVEIKRHFFFSWTIVLFRKIMLFYLTESFVFKCLIKMPCSQHKNKIMFNCASRKGCVI